MSKKSNVWISPRAGGGWRVHREGGQRDSARTDTKAQAEQRGRDIARREGVEIIIQDQQGRIHQRESYGNDPVPPRDREH